jgi:hypothetical protein
MGGDEAALHQIAAFNEALTLAVSRVAVGAVRSKRTGQPFRSPAVRGWKVCRMFPQLSKFRMELNSDAKCGTSNPIASAWHHKHNRLVGRPLAHSHSHNPLPAPGTTFSSVYLWDIRQRESPHARGGPVPKVCNRVPGHGSTGATKRKQASLEQSSGAMASLREAN